MLVVLPEAKDVIDQDIYHSYRNVPNHILINIL